MEQRFDDVENLIVPAVAKFSELISCSGNLEKKTKY